MSIQNKIAHLKNKLNSSQLEQGKQLEEEHKDVYNDIKKDVDQDNKFDMDFSKFTEDIASDHIEEDPNYYTKLKEMEKKSFISQYGPFKHLIVPSTNLVNAMYRKYENKQTKEDEVEFYDNGEHFATLYTIGKIKELRHDGTLDEYGYRKTNKTSMKKKSILTWVSHSPKDADIFERELENSIWYAERDGLIFTFPDTDGEEDITEKAIEDDFLNPHQFAGHWESHDIQSRFSSFNTKTGINEEIEVDPLLEETLTFEEPEVQTVGPEAVQIDPTQSGDQIKNQLLAEVSRMFPNRLTYDTIYETVQMTGLDTLDKYDLIGIMNGVALELGLPRIGWDGYFPSDDEVWTNNIQGTIGAPSYSDDGINMEEISELYDNSPDKLFVLDRIIDERVKLLTNYDDIVDQSTEVVTKSLQNIKKKSCVPIKYYYQGITKEITDRAGRVVQGKVIYSVRLRNNENLKMERTIDLELPIKMAKVEHPRTFKFNKIEYPLDTYYLNDLF